MKIVFYNCLFGDNRFPETNDKIIYSYLVYKSLPSIDGAFNNSQNSFSFDAVGDFWKDNSYSEIYGFSAYKASKDLGMSINTIKSRISMLEGIGAIRIEDSCLYVGYTEQIKTSYYFELLLDTNLKGEKLIVYSYLKNKSNKYGNVISTFDVNQAKEFYMSKKHYQKILCELYNKGFAERLENGKLKIN